MPSTDNAKTTTKGDILYVAAMGVMTIACVKIAMDVMGWNGHMLLESCYIHGWGQWGNEWIRGGDGHGNKSMPLLCARGKLRMEIP
jgi:hypothetical protein